MLLHYNSPCSQLGCMYITAALGFDLAASIPMHIHLVALHNHNATMIQIALFNTLVVQWNTAKQTPSFFHGGTFARRAPGALPFY